MSQRPSTVQRIYLLGGLHIETAAGAQRLTSRKAIQLLAYLALHAHAPQSREVLADQLWPASAPDRSRPGLSDAVYRLKQAVGPTSLIIADDRIALNPQALWVDVWAFDQHCAAQTLASLQQAVDLYRGDLLPELYDDWLLPPRVALREKYLIALFELGHLFEQAHDLPAALDAYRRLSAADPLREDAHGGIMRCLARLNRHPAALQQYAQLAQTLQAELKIDPLPETRALADAIRAELALRQVTPLRASFVGRAAERAQALEAVEAAIAGRGGALAIEGPGGIGKSRLWEEIAAGAKWRGVTIVAARAVEHFAESPFTPLSEALAQALHGPRAAQIEVLLPAETLAAVGELYSPWRDRSTPIDLPPDQARRRFQRAVIKVWQALASLAPHVILLDDVQWATAALWETLDALLAEIRSQRLLIGLAYRRPDIEHTAGWLMLQSWERDGRLQTIELKPLTLSEVTELVPPVHRSHAAAIAALSGGNPFYVTQMQITLNEGYPLDRQPVLTRAAALPATAQAALAAAAVLGDKVLFRSWAPICELPPIELAAVAEQLVVQGFLQIDTGGYRFTHDLIQAISYEQIDPDERQRLHQRAAQAMREFDLDNAHALAYHLDCAGEPEEAVRHYRAAGAHDLARFAFAEARAAFERALQLWPAVPTVERLETLLDLAQIGDSTGDRERQASALNAILHDAQQLKNEEYVIRALLGLGRLAAVTGEVELAEQRLHETLGIVEHHPDHVLHFDASFYSGDLAARRGRLAEARAHFEQARQQAQLLGDARREARALRGLGITARLSGDLPQALALTEQALALHKASGDQFGASVTLTNLLAVLYDLGAHDRLLALADDALALKEQLGDVYGAAIVRHTQGLAAAALGDFDLARDRLSAALRDFEAVQDRRTAGLARNVLGLVAESEGRFDEARREFEMALASAEAVGAAAEAAYAQYDLGALLLRLNDHHAAIPLLEAARAKWRELGNDLLQLKSEAFLGLALLADGDRSTAHELAEENWRAFQRGGLSGEQPQSWLWALYQLLDRLNQPERAILVLRAADAELQRQGEAISDDHLRQQFFHRVPLNRSIVEAYDQLNQRQRRLTVTLARAAVPLGRKLTDRDVVTIEWTIAAPEDDALTDPIDRRRHILSRLIAEARSAGAAPTDDDLARALDVSRRTILRDIEALAQSGVKLPTRRRRK